MKKKLIVLLTFSLALVSLSIYLFLTKEIIIGNLKIAEGQKKIIEGEQLLANGEARLASGKQKLSRVKSSYSKLRAVPFLALNTLPVAGQIITVASDEYAGKKIASGNQQVAAGAKKIDAGKMQLAQGKLQLQHGILTLQEANNIRIACGIYALLFTGLTLFLLFFWRKSLFFFKKTRHEKF